MRGAGTGHRRTAAPAHGSTHRREVRPNSNRWTGWTLGLALLIFGPAAIGQPVAAGDPPGAVAPVALDTSHAARDASWVVLEVRGTANWRSEDEARWRTFDQGQVLPPSSVVETGVDGEVTLVTGGDVLLIGASSRLVVPRNAEFAALRHERGRLLVHVEPRRDRTFRVRTPLLSMGIKGTSFELAVDPDQERVLVLDGEVEVSTPGSDQPVDLRAGEGLAQPTAPRTPSRAFERPMPPLAWPRAPEQRWLMPDDAEPGLPGRVEPYDQLAEEQPHRLERGSAGGGPVPRTERRAQHERPDEAAGPKVGDHFLIMIGLGAGILLLLIGPGHALMELLREQWQERTSTKGRRRRSLVRDL